MCKYIFNNYLNINAIDIYDITTSMETCRKPNNINYCPMF